MNDLLFQYLSAGRTRLITGWAGHLAPAGSDPAAYVQTATQGFDGLVHSLHDPQGEVFHAYIERVVKPWLRIGTPVSDLQRGAEALAVLIHADIDATVGDRADRFHLHKQLTARLRAAYAAWDVAAVQVAMERFAARGGL